MVILSAALGLTLGCFAHAASADANISYFRDACQPEPKNTDPAFHALWMKAYKAIEVENFALCETSFREAAKKDPELSAAAQYNQAICTYNLKKYQDGIQLFNEAIAKQPTLKPFALKQLASLETARAKVLIESGNLSDAEKLLQSALSRTPEDSEASSELAFVYQRQKKFSECITVASRALLKSQTSVELLANRAGCYVALDLESKAKDDLDSALQIQADFLPALVMRASIYAQLGKCSLAKKDARAAVKQDPTAQSYFKDPIKGCSLK